MRREILHLASTLAILLATASACELLGPPNREREVVVTLTSDTTAILVGESTTLRARVRGDSARVAQGVRWSSSDPGIATVDSVGTVTGVGPGRATIMVESVARPSARATATVMVVSPFGRYPVTISIQSDSLGAEPAIGLTNVAFLDVSLAGTTVTVSGPPPWIEVSGTLAPNFRFAAEGSGTVAGTADVPVRLSNGRLAAERTETGAAARLSGTYRVGRGAQVVTYAIEGHSP